MNNADTWKTVGEAVWRPGSEFSVGLVWDAYLSQRKMLNRWLGIIVWSSEGESRMELHI